MPAKSTNPNLTVVKKKAPIKSTPAPGPVAPTGGRPVTYSRTPGQGGPGLPSTPAPTQAQLPPAPAMPSAVLPPPPPASAPKVYTPLLDFSKSGDPNKFDWSDLFPNFQAKVLQPFAEAVKPEPPPPPPKPGEKPPLPIAAPLKTVGKIAGAVPEVVMGAFSLPGELSERALGVTGIGAGMPVPQFTKALNPMEYINAAGTIGRNVLAPLVGAEQQTAGGAAPIIPPFVRNALASGLEAAAAAIQSMPQGKTAGVSAEMDKAVADAITGWMKNQAAALKKGYDEMITPGERENAVATLAANAIGTVKALGLPPEMAKPFEGVLNLLVPDGERRAELLAEQQQYTTDARAFHEGVVGNIMAGRWDLAGKAAGQAWEAANWTYEGGEKVSRAFNRLAAGENPDAVFASIDASLTLRDRAKDFIGQAFIDPTNLWGVVQAPKYLRDIKTSKAARFLVAAPEAGKLVEGGGKLGTFIGKIPLVGKLGERTGASLAARYGDEAVGLLGELAGAVRQNPDAAKKLAALGIDAHPLQVLNELLLNPETKKIAGVAVDTEKVREALGIAARVAGPEEAKALGTVAGATLDMLKSEVANNTRKIFLDFGKSNLAKAAEKGGKLVSPLDESYKAMNKVYDLVKSQQGVMKGYTETGEVLDKAGKVLTGNDAIIEIGNRMADILTEMDKVYRAAYNIPAPSKNIPTEIMQGLQAAFSVFQLSPFNPGHVVRNYFQNQVALMADGVRGFSGTTDIYQKLAALDMPAPFLGWGGGQAFLGNQSNLLQKLRNTPLARLNDVIEKTAQMSAFVGGVEKTFNSAWRIGKAIPAEAWNRVSSLLPASVANKLQVLVETARTQKQLDQIAGKLSGEAWRLVDSPELAGKLHDAGLLSEVENILQTAGDKAEAMNRITELFNPDTSKLVDMAAMQQPLKGTLDAEWAQSIWRDFKEVLKDLTPDQMASEWNDFWREVGKQRVYLRQADAYAQQSIAALPGEAGKQAAIEYSKLYGQIPRHGTAEGIEEFVTRSSSLLKVGDLESLKQIYPDIFGQAHSMNEAWALYYAQKNAKWTDRYIGLGDEIVAFAQKYGADPKRAPSLEAIEGVLPLERKTKETLQKKLFTMLDANGFRDANERNGGKHFANWLHKHGFIDSHYFKWQDVKDKDWYNKVVDAIQEYGKNPEKFPTSAPEEIFRAADEVIQPRPAISHMGQDILAGRIAQMTNEQQLVADALKWIEGKSDDVMKLAPEQLDAVNGLAKELAPRLTETRTVGQRVGQAFIEGTVFNYGDRRNFDTALGFIFNYPFWYTRNLAQWARRAWYQPAALAALVKMTNAIRAMNRDKPEWWKDQIILEGIAGQTLFIPIQGLLNPLNSFFGDKYRDPNKRNTWYGTLLDEVQQYGPGLHALFPLVMATESYWGRGNKEEAISWQNYLGQPSRGINALSALALGALGEDNPMPGGLGLEFYLWEQGRFVGSPSDAKRIYYAIGEMVKNGEMTREQAADLMINPTGPLWDRALQKSRENSAASVLMSWLLGAPLKPRPEFELEIQTMMTERAALVAGKDGMTNEEYRLAWADMRSKYPWMDYVVAASRNQADRQSSYAWSVFNRLPPNSSEYFHALGFSKDEVNVMNALMDKFYDKNVGLDGMNPLEREQFMNTMYQMGAILALPDDATAREWEMARQARNAMFATLEQQYPGVQALEDSYFEILNTQGREAANTFIEQHAMLENYWRDKDKMVAADANLSKYYASMEQYERVLWADWQNEMERKYPGIGGLFDEYYLLKENDPEGARKFFKEHPVMKAYYSERDVFTLSLRDQLEQFGDKVMAMEPQFAALREDADITTPGQQSVADLIASGSRPMGDFELPEDLPDRETNAAIGNLLESVPPGQMGGVISYLRRNGGLDGVLDAYYEFRNTGTVAANRKEVGALLTALQNVFAEKGWSVLGEGADFLAKAMQKSSGTGSGKRLRSYSRGSRGGGGGGGGAGKAAQQKVAEMMGLLRDKAPTIWENLRRMADMTNQDRQAFLRDPKMLTFLQYLKQANLLGLLPQILAYFESLHVPPTPSTTHTSTRAPRIVTTRFQNPGL